MHHPLPLNRAATLNPVTTQSPPSYRNNSRQPVAMVVNRMLAVQGHRKQDIDFHGGKSFTIFLILLNVFRSLFSKAIVRQSPVAGIGLVTYRPEVIKITNVNLKNVS